MLNTFIMMVSGVPLLFMAAEFVLWLLGRGD